MDRSDSKTAARRGPAQVWIRRTARGAVWLLAIVVFYGLMVLELGSLAANPDYVQADSGTEIRVWSNGIHTDFVVPVRSRLMDWGAFAPYSKSTPPEQLPEYAVIGWGDHDFYIETPTEADFSLATTLRAIFLPTKSVMHVSYYDFRPELGHKCVRLLLNDEEYQQFVSYLKSGFALDSRGKPVEIAGANYGIRDVFFRGTGSYHLLNTCNNWANQALQTVGVRTPVWSPFEYAIFDHVKNR
ncbi:MAG: TIGR02117 family protein [Planctomycetota bacterium]|nr:TIGR02117 family protein [Planctomycetota bacterium]